jgi:hypothetical protein
MPITSSIGAAETSMPLFPKLKGLAWPKKETADTTGMTLVKKSASGRRVTIQLSPYPIYHIDLQYAGLSSSLNGAERLGPGGMLALQALFAQMGGQFGVFRVKRSDYTLQPEDSQVSGQQLGFGDGANSLFVCTRTISGAGLVPDYTEPVGMIEPTGANVYVNGSVQSAANYDFVYPNIVRFAGGHIPAVGAIITADYSWYFICAFEEDTLELDAVMKGLWTADSIKIVTVKN